MTDEAHNQVDGNETPVFPAGPAGPHEQTIKLDKAIAEGNISLPSHFGRYQVLKRIGIGGFASVYSAFDPELESEVAVKVLAENHSANSIVRQRFVAEARVARRLGNDRLIGVFDLGEADDGRPFVVMELAPRGTLRQRIVRTGKPSRDDLVRLINQLGACLTAIHDKGVVHRDIKPSNLLFRTEESADFLPARLIEDDERLVLADFGLARDISGGASAMTVGGGTEGYMAPEQATTDGKPDFRADIFSATVVVAEMTTGRRPERLDLATADISTDMLEALTRSMSMDRDRRPATAEEWRLRLADAYTGDSATSYPHPVDHEAKTASLDTTRIADQPLPATDIQTSLPLTGLEPITYTPAARNQNPAPPPGLAIPTNERPPPAEPERPNAIIAAARAQAAAEQREAEAKAARKAARRQERARPKGRQPRPGTAGGPAQRPPAADIPTSADAPPTAPPVAPANPPTPASQPVTQPITPRTGTTPGNQPLTQPAPQPTGRPVAGIAPPGQRPAQPPQRATASSVGQSVRPAQQRPMTVGGAAGTTSPPPIQAGHDGDQAEVSRRRSRQHMKTAGKLAKLERKQSRKLVRKARRRRKRRRVANVFLALIRGTLAGGLTFVSCYLVALAVIGPQVDNRPGVQGLIVLLSGFAFLWGLSYFPFPRSYEV